ncbi:isopeptide-forming domain-containing fimbrial protein [Bifidobacterium felsineum]|uniref:isopeptide-forming domain-containing fimbrial protein n=1 Tax=Bifidobacterium felsineum TaxID=2045440 RepID=UPI001BDC69F6|nr:isopeptide-forming domain-containing fimbrial protein [Bifidobacterium felsineum]MBT1164674.1 isopeptide-forming domain-containing fimbrial protein [Bifidobacterium felsineum]
MRLKPLTTLLAVLMLLTPVTPAMAVQTGSPTDRGSITVNNVQGGSTVTAYKIIDVNYTNEGTDAARSYVPTDPQYSWDPDVEDFVRGGYPKYIGDDNRVMDGFTKLASDLRGEPKPDGSSSSDLAEFMDRLSNQVGNEKVELTAAKTVNVDGTADATSVVLDGLRVGGYLVKVTNQGGNTEGNGPGVVTDYIYRPMFTTIGFQSDDAGAWSVSSPKIAAKRDKATVDKTVNEQDNDGHNSGKDQKDTGSDMVGVGDVVTYNIRTDVPVFPLDAISKDYRISDRMDPALTPNYRNQDDNRFLIYGVDENGQETQIGDGTAGNGTYYHLVTANAEDFDQNPQTWAMDFQYETIRRFKKIHVIYTATVNSNAIPGQPIYNDTKLQYTNNPYDEDTYRTVPDRVKVYVTGLKVRKSFEGMTGKPAEGAAIFTLKRKNSTDPIRFVKTASGSYRPAMTGETGGTSLPIDEDGLIHVTGLKAGDYILDEVKTPAGWLPAHDLPVTLTMLKEGEDYNGHLDKETQPGVVTVDVENKRILALLPSSGSQAILLLIPPLLIILLGVLLVRRRS